MDDLLVHSVRSLTVFIAIDSIGYHKQIDVDDHEMVYSWLIGMQEGVVIGLVDKNVRPVLAVLGHVLVRGWIKDEDVSDGKDDGKGEVVDLVDQNLGVLV